MADFFGDLERLVADLYPYRWPITAGILVAMALAAAYGYRRGWHMVIWRHRIPVAAVGTPMLVLAVITGWYVVSPLFIDKRVDEELPFAVNAVVPPGMTRLGVESVMEGMAKIDQEMNEAMPASMMKLAGDDTMGEGTSGGVVKLGTDGTGSSQPSGDDAMEKPDEGTASSQPSDDAMEKPDEGTTSTQPSDDDAMEKPDEGTTSGQPSDDDAMEKPDEGTTGSQPPEEEAIEKPDDSATSSQPPEEEAMEKPEEQPAAPETQPVAVRLKIGELKDADSFHKGSGQAIIYRGPDGSHLLRLENLSVTNGPDLHVLLSPHPDPQSRDQVKQPGYVDLGKLKGNKGNQNYEIPSEVDVSIQGSVVIYCKPFSVIFSVAPLQDVS